MSLDPVILRPATEDDLPLLERFLTDPEAGGPFNWQGWIDLRLWRRRFEENRLLGEDSGQLMVACAGEPVGFVSWRKVQTSRSSYCWNMGICLLPAGRGRGVGTQAQQLLVRYLFAHTQMHRIEAETEADNIAEQRALEKAGFTWEGTVRGAAFRDGQWRDSVRYSVLRSDMAQGSGW